MRRIRMRRPGRWSRSTACWHCPRSPSYATQPATAIPSCPRRNRIGPPRFSGTDRTRSSRPRAVPASPSAREAQQGASVCCSLWAALGNKTGGLGMVSPRPSRLAVTLADGRVMNPGSREWRRGRPKPPWSEEVLRNRAMGEQGPRADQAEPLRRSCRGGMRPSWPAVTRPRRRYG